MYPELYQYLLLHKKLPVPGIGTFSLDRKPAEIDFPNKLMLPPVYSFGFQASAPVPTGKFFHWLGSILGISQMDAVIRFNDFAFEWKKQIEKGHTVTWNGVGTIRKGLAGEVKFTAQEPLVKEQPVPAVKVLREKAEHTVRVGEDEKTSVEMEELLTRSGERKTYWWAIALAIGLSGLIFIGWYFSRNGLDVPATSNIKQATPSEPATDTYKELR